MKVLTQETSVYVVYFYLGIVSILSYVSNSRYRTEIRQAEHNQLRKKSLKNQNRSQLPLFAHNIIHGATLK